MAEMRQGKSAGSAWGAAAGRIIEGIPPPLLSSHMELAGDDLR